MKRVAGRTRGAGMVLLLLASLMGGACAGGSRYGGGGAAVSAQARPASWAQRIEAQGLPKFHRVDDNLYRSAQPSAAGLRQAKRLGIKTVVNLRGSDSDREMIQGLGLNYVWIPMNAFEPEDRAFDRFLRTVGDRSQGPFLVHCRQGKDRTGAACALYRSAIQGWEPDEGIREMRRGGYGFNELFFQNLIGYVREYDVRPYAPLRGRRPEPRHASAATPRAATVD